MAEQQRRHREKLAEYYGTADPTSPPPEVKKSEEVSGTGGPYDINSASFDPDLYSQRLLREASLSQLMAQEGEIVRQIHGLDSDMQTLVYENYNKFIAATDTIRKMRVDFRDMESEMELLADKMKNVTDSSSEVNKALRERRLEVSKLSGTHALLKKLQFLFELPTKLNECIVEQNWSMGVKFYVRAQRVLDQYKHVASFQGIRGDCDQIMIELKAQLKNKMMDQESSSPQDMAQCVHLLLQLNQPPAELCYLYLETCSNKLQVSLENLAGQVSSAEKKGENAMDILDFVDQACNTFLSDLSLVIAAYNDTFSSLESEEEMIIGTEENLSKFVDTLVADQFFNLIKARMKCETNLAETALLVRSLDRFHRRVQAMVRLLPVNTKTDLSRKALELVLHVSKSYCHVTLDHLHHEFVDNSLVEARKRLVAPQSSRVLSSSNSEYKEPDLKEINGKLLAELNERLRLQTTNNLQLFLDPELTFAVKPQFRSTFSRVYVREGVVVAHFKHILQVCRDFCSDGATEKTVPPILLLLLSRTCLDLQSHMTANVLSLVDEQLLIDDTSGLTTLNKLNGQFKAMSQTLLNHYVKLEGQILSQMLSKSVETRDWLNTVEPRSVRAVMKRVVEEITCIDRQVGELYEEGSRKARSSDSSRRTRFSSSHSKRSLAFGRSWANSGGMNTSLASNIQKMFNEKIEIFSPVECSKISVLTGVVKIALKTLLECVRLRTFSRFGFQQMQVDGHYLNLYLWRFVSDENLVTFLLDEVMTSAVHRCCDPVPMEQSVVEVICDRG